MNLEQLRLCQLIISGGGDIGAVIDSQLYKRPAKDQADVDRWLKANAIFGGIVAVGLVAMALIGSFDSGVTQRAATISKTAEVSSAAIRIQISPPLR
jgi:hypothetical protein